MKYLEPFGVSPAERLAERFPEVVEAAALTKTELADAAKLHSLINRAIRGEKLPAQTLSAIERRFPDMGRRFRALSEKPATAEKELRDILSANQKLIKTLQKRLEKAEAVDIEAIKAEARTEAIRKGMPDEQRLREAFKLMDYEDRLAFRDTMNSQMADIDRMVYEQGEELAGLMEHFAAEAASEYISVVQKFGWFKGEIKYLSVTDYKIFTGAKWVVEKGEVGGKPFTRKVLKGGSEPTKAMMTPDGKKVRWEYALDSIATEKGYASGEAFKGAIEKMLETKIKIDDLKLLNKMGQDRLDGIKRMLGILDDVDTRPELITKYEPAAIEPARPYEPLAPEAIPGKQVVEYKTTTGVKVKLTPEEAVRMRQELVEVVELTERRLTRLKATQKKKPHWEGYDPYVDEVVGIDVRIEEQYAVLGVYREDLTTIEKAMEKAGIVPGAVPRPVEAVMPEMKEAWQMTRAEYIASGKDIRMPEVLSGEHKAKVNQAIAEGKPVPPEVLKDYPDLARAIPEAATGMPEAGVQKDIFGYEHPVFPKGKGEVTQISMEDYGKLVETWKKAGLPEDSLPTAIKPKIEGVKGLEGEAQAVRVAYEPPKLKSGEERKEGLEALRNEVKALTEARKAPYWQARAERAFRMEQVRQPGIGEGYITQPFAGGRIFEQDFIDSFNRFFGHDAGLGVLSVTADTAGLLRIVKAALDLSYPVIQGQLSWGLAHAYLMFNPPVGIRMCGSWYSTFCQQIGAFFNPNILYKWLAKNEATVMQRVTAGGSMRAVFMFQEMRAVVGEGVIARAGEKLLYKIPLNPYQRAEWAFFTGGELLRDKFWKILAPKAIAKGESAKLARYLDLLTGIADPRAMGVPLTVRQLEQSFIWFSSAYTRSYLTLLAEIFRGGFTGAKAREAIAGFIGAGAAYYTGLQYAISTLQGKSDDEAWETIRQGFGVYVDPLTGEIEWRPTAQFLSIKIGDTSYGLGGGIYGLIRLAGNISATVQEIGEKETIDLVRILKHGSLNKRDNPFINWWYTRASAFTGAVYDAVVVSCSVRQYCFSVSVASPLRKV